MENKVLLAYVIIDIAFALTGAMMIGFSVIVQNTMFAAPTDGQNAVVNLLYQQFPLTAGIANGAFILGTFALSIPAIATPSRGWLKAAGAMTVVCSLFSLVVGLYLWILTLRTKETFFPVYAGSTPDIQKLMQSSVSSVWFCHTTTPVVANSFANATPLVSSNAAATSTARCLPSRRTRFARVQHQRR
jgi:hypothetical protein